MTRSALPLVAWLAFLSAARAGEGPPPAVVHARLQTRSAAAGLEEAVRAIVRGAGPAWIGYAVPVDGAHSMCCWESIDAVEHTACPGCRLEGKGAFTVGSAPGPVNLEADRTFVVFLRTEGGRIGSVRSLSWSCAVDAGGLPLFWLDDVRPAESVRLLASLVRVDDEPQRDVMDGALLALSMHTEPSALDTLIETARRDASGTVRGQALFWLAQKAGQRAAATIARAVEDDPESQVRERAVFALSQLPRDEGVPRLIALARAHRDPLVRKKAIFWLGQSEDPRALAFFEEVLRK